ncbi:MAG: DUF2237 domain-containing protein [Gammaproteobacteria bacterium]|nr:DUF2237 domain-containing protein [Gammaproteobacteria bacterium]MBL6818934.1 DUF2237 domain-containing protein [Gammaproteobacteria bacterium]MBL6898707.1 DUF2237 domain-containing protein [Gammaproteobacteria bacterium]
MSEPQKNVIGENIELCGSDPITGYHRDGCCNTDNYDRGSHTVCAVVTDEFLEFSKSRGNDLITPIPELGFNGLVHGDSWCLCADRWLEAYQNNKAPYVKIKSTNIKALEKIDLDSLKEFALDIS